MKNPFEKNIKNIKTENIITPSGSVVKIYNDGISTDNQGGTVSGSMPTFVSTDTLFVSGNIVNWGSITSTKVSRFELGINLNVTTAQKNTITQIGTIVYDTDMAELQRWNGSVWEALIAGTPPAPVVFGYNFSDVGSGHNFISNSPFPSANNKEYTVAMIFHCVNTGSANTAAFTIFDNLGSSGTPDGYGVWFHGRDFFRFDYRRDADQNTSGINLTGIPGPLPGKTYAVAFSHTSGALLTSVNGSDTQVTDNFGGAAWNKGIPIVGGIVNRAARPDSNYIVLAMSMFEGNVGQALNASQLKTWTAAASQTFGPSTMFLPTTDYYFDFTNQSQPLASPASFTPVGSLQWNHTVNSPAFASQIDVTNIIDFPDYS